MSVDPRALVRRMAAAALNAQAEYAEQETRRRAPRDEGDLDSSFFIDEATPSDLRAQVGTGSEYAVIQHEALSWRHDDGEAKYMENAVTGGAAVRAFKAAAEQAARRVGG